MNLLEFGNGSGTLEVGLVAELPPLENSDEYSLLRCWLLCRKFGYDNKSLMQAVSGIANVQGKLLRIQKAYDEGRITLPDRIRAVEIFQEYGVKEMPEHTDVPELEAFTWPTICTLGNSVLRRCPFMITHFQPSVQYDDLLGAVLIPVPDGQVNARARSFVLTYSVASDSVEEMHADLVGQLGGFAVDLIVGTLPPQNEDENQAFYFVLARVAPERARSIAVPTPPLSINEKVP